MRERAVTLLGVAMLLLLAWSLNYLAHRGALGVGARRFAQLFTLIGSNARLFEAALASPPPAHAWFVVMTMDVSSRAFVQE